MTFPGGPGFPPSPYLNPLTGPVFGQEAGVAADVQAAAGYLGSVPVDAAMRDFAMQGGTFEAQQALAHRMAVEGFLAQAHAHVAANAFAAHASSMVDQPSIAPEWSPSSGVQDLDGVDVFLQHVYHMPRPSFPTEAIAEPQSFTDTWQQVQALDPKLEAHNVPLGLIEGDMQPHNIDDLVQAGLYHFIDPDITEACFPLGDTPIDLSNAQFVRINDAGPGAAIVYSMQRMGLRPGTMSELLLYAAQNPDRQRQNPLVALGSTWKGPDGTLLAGCVRGNKTYRMLGLYDYDRKWSTICSFLTFPVEKVAAEQVATHESSAPDSPVAPPQVSSPARRGYPQHHTAQGSITHYSETLHTDGPFYVL